MTDLMLLNDVKVKDAYPLTNIPENLQKLKGAKIFTLIDACRAYHCIQIEEGSGDCRAFISPLGLSGTFVRLLVYPMLEASLAGC